MTAEQIQIGAGYGQWEAKERGERPIVNEGPVSCLTPKYQKDVWVATIHDNKSIFRLPGQKEQTNDKCGKWVHPLKCPNTSQTTLEGGIKHDQFVAQHSCHKPDCPICYESWASRQASNTADRLIQAVKLYRKAGYKIETPNGSRIIGRIDHVVYSPPQDLAKQLIRTPGGARTLRSMAIDKIRSSGMVAGAIIFHPFRQNDPDEPNFNPEIPVYEWYESPHFHVVGCGYLRKSNEFYDITGWAYKKMERRETIKGTIKYTLTHCGIADGFQALTYFGLFSNNKIVVESIEKITEPIKCRACGEALHLFRINETSEGVEVDWNEDLGVYLHVVVKKTYALNKKKLKYVYDPGILGYVKKVC